MAIITCFVSAFLVSCQWGIEDGVQQDENSTFDLDETIKIEEYLETSVSELADYKQFIENQSSGAAQLLVETNSSLRQMGEKKYYPVYVGEQWRNSTEYRAVYLPGYTTARRILFQCNPPRKRF